jgi:hypothetical protein
MSENMGYLAFWAWLIQFEELQLYSFSCRWHNFFFVAEYYSVVHMYHMFFMHLSVGGHLGWFYRLAIVYSVAINVDLQKSLLYVDMHKSDIAGS